jgi:hypothetical protein
MFVKSYIVLELVMYAKLGIDERFNLNVTKWLNSF